MPILGIMASQISGHLWAPEGAYDSLATVTLSATTASVTFAGIPAGYKHLQIRGISKPSTSGDYDWSIQFNSDTSSNYSKHQVFGDGSTVYATGSASQTQIPGAFNQYTDFGGFIVDILDYQNTSKNKTVRTLTGVDRNGNGLIGMRSGYWNNTTAVSSIQIIPTSGSSGIAQYSQFALYGVK